MAPPFIYINGYPGVGKLAVARQLRLLVPGAKLFDNHSLIDATSAIFERTMPEYQPLRKHMRQLVLGSIARSASTKDVTWIFTDQQSSDPIDSTAAHDYHNAAEERGSPLVSIILNCGPGENERRLVSSDREGQSTKLTDIAILRAIRETEDIYHHGGDLELEIDVTNIAPVEAAAQIKAFVDKQA